ncbi:MAG: prepilin-type N-terminal cleavage/methylation domain-containing protein [Oscillospiraceae bacterium]|nr:prepilin-type N-terminal cleavage/methylation domain-containing protein [Oscillospiraceae bacterium]
MKKVMERTFRRMNANRNNGKKALKGFTLVEIIVVLVILAILAAAMIPALTGYIDKAKEKTAIAEARSVVTAAQTIASEEYALHGPSNMTSDWIVGKKTDILALADVTGDKAGISDVTFTKAKITGLKYTTGDGTYDITYSSSSGFTVAAHSGS